MSDVVKICQHGGGDCAPLTRGEYGAAVVVPLLLPLLAVASSLYWRYQRAGDTAAAGDGRGRSAWAKNRAPSVARRRAGRGGASTRGVKRSANQPNSSRNHSRTYGIELSERAQNTRPAVLRSHANPAAGGTLQRLAAGSLRMRAPASNDDDLDDDVDDQYTTCQVRLTGEWTCPRCTFAGNGRHALACGMCALRKPPVEEVFVPPELGGGWRDVTEEAEDEGKEGGRFIDDNGGSGYVVRQGAERPAPGFYRGDTIDSQQSEAESANFDDDDTSAALRGIELMAAGGGAAARNQQTTI